MVQSAQVVIIGGGVIGVSIACHLGWRGVSDVILLERESLLGTQSTALCAGGIRAQFSSEINVRLQMESLRQFEVFEEQTGVSPLFRQVGYLFLLGTDDLAAAFLRNLEMQRALGLDVQRLTPEEARKLAPVIQTEDVVAANFCSRDGIADPSSVTAGYAQSAKNAGVKILVGKEVVGIRRDTEFTVSTRDGDTFRSDYLVNAAGPWASEIGRMLGIDIPVLPYRRQIFTTAPFAEIPQDMPMVVDLPCGLYMHPESGGLLMGLADPQEPPGYNLNTDQDFMITVFEKAIHRVPCLERAEIGRGWAGLYETSPDEHAILGPADDLPRLLLANGFSGHGFMQAPAVGKLIAEIIVDGMPSIDVSGLSLSRFNRGLLHGKEIVI
jgi:sarcosine oxidase subunit beta